MRLVEALLRISCLQLASSLAGCSEGEEPPVVELPEGVTELSAADFADSSGTAGASSLGESPADAEENNAYLDFLAALDSHLLEQCNCRFAELGHETPTDCFEQRVTPAFAKTCELNAFTAYANELEDRYECLAELRNQAVLCFRERGCEAIDACEATRLEARPDCGGLLFADGPVWDQSSDCQRNARMGFPSGCPDVAAPSSELGPRVFEGQTTGAGNDVTLSCHPDFVDFESADRVMTWQAPTAGRYRFGTENSDFVTQLGLLADCGGEEIACAPGDSRVFGGAAIEVELEALQTVFVAVEGYSLESTGYFALSVTRLP